MNRFVLPVIAAALAAGPAVAPAGAQHVPPPRIGVPMVPLTLEVPAGHTPFLKGSAVGTQNFVCLPAASGVAWTFLGPQATLFESFKGELRRQLTTHFLSTNRDETGTRRPTWQDSGDSSQVWGRVAASSADPNFVEPGAIPWLLLEAAGTEPGPRGGDRLAQTTYIHRVNTSGGIAPSSGCSAAGHVGALALVPYTTEYVFYRAEE